MDTNFFAINSHGCELNEQFIIPENIRILMFCPQKEYYCILVQHKWLFSFITRKYDSYYDFLETIRQSPYSLFWGNFCVFKPGNYINEILLTPDISSPDDESIEPFRSGVFEIPLKIQSKEGSEITSLLDSKPANITSYHINLTARSTRLTDIINTLLRERGGGTIILTLCRNPCKSKSQKPETQSSEQEISRLGLYQPVGTKIVDEFRLVQAEEGIYYQLIGFREDKLIIYIDLYNSLYQIDPKECSCKSLVLPEEYKWYQVGTLRGSPVLGMKTGNIHKFLYNNQNITVDRLNYEIHEIYGEEIENVYRCVERCVQ